MLHHQYHRVSSAECRVSIECRVPSVECPSSDRWVSSSDRRVSMDTQRTLDGHSTGTRRTLDTRHSTLGGIGSVTSYILMSWAYLNIRKQDFFLRVWHWHFLHKKAIVLPPFWNIYGQCSEVNAHWQKERKSLKKLVSVMMVTSVVEIHNFNWLK